MAANDALFSQIQLEGKGWNCKLFINKDKMDEYKCKLCDNICVDCVELGCDHEDIDIEIYCNKCLIKVINNNNKTCPINSKHINPNIQSNRAIRKQILKLQVMCPNSLEYKSALNNDNINMIYDTIEEKEGGLNNNNNKNNINSCNWIGNLNELILNHLKNCKIISKDLMVKNIEILKEEISGLQYDNNNLKKEINLLKKNNIQIKNDFRNKNEKQINKINQLSKQVKENGNELLTKDKQINKLSVKITYEINDLKIEMGEKDKQIQKNVNDLLKKDKKINKLTKTFDDLNKKMDKKDYEIKQMKNDFKNKNEKRMNEINNLKIEKDKQINDLNSKMFEKDAKFTNLCNEIVYLKKEMNKLLNVKNVIKNENIEEKNEEINLLKIAYKNNKNNKKLINEKWDKNTLYSDYLTINGNKVSAVGGGSAFGIQTIKDGITIWRFKIVKGYYWLIGIANAQKVKKMTTFFNTIPDSYSCYGNGQSYNQKKAISNNNGLRFGPNDILVMCYNNNSKQLLFSVNQSKFKMMFKNINTSLKYKMAVCNNSWVSDYSIELECCIHIN